MWRSGSRFRRWLFSVTLLEYSLVERSFSIEICGIWGSVSPGSGIWILFYIQDYLSGLSLS